MMCVDRKYQNIQQNTTLNNNLCKRQNSTNSLDSGYGVEKVNGKYLVNIHYLSCELADTAAYKDVMNNLQTTAMIAALRVETVIAQGKGK